MPSKPAAKHPVRGLRYLNMGPWPVMVGITADQRAFDRETARIGIPSEPVAAINGATAHMYAKPGHSLLYIIGMSPDYRDYSLEQVAAMIAHEAVHIVQDMRRELARNSDLGDEAEAYLVQQIVQDCAAFLYERGTSRRIRPRGKGE